jgi:uncharacterized protein YecT (DUF1311 family)
MQRVLKLALIGLLALLTWHSAAAARANCDLSSDAPSDCLQKRLHDAERVTGERTAALQTAIDQRVTGDPSGISRYSHAAKESDAAWRKSKEANCLIVEAAFYDGSGRLNAVLQCELDETEFRNASLAKLLLQFGTRRNTSGKPRSIK